MKKTEIRDICFEKFRYFRYSDNTAESYTPVILEFIEYVGKQIKEINGNDFEKFLYSIEFNSESQQNRYISALIFFYDRVLKRKYNKVEFDRPRKSKPLPRIIDWNKLEDDFIKIQNIKHRAIIEIACRCALRVSEVCNIKVTDVDSSSMFLLVRDSKFNKDRYVGISAKLLKLLRDYYAKEKPTDYLFRGQYGGKYSVSSCQKIFKKYIDSTKSFHTCRHSGLTEMINRGSDLSTVQGIAGHSSPLTTGIYIHTSKKLLQEAAI